MHQIGRVESGVKRKTAWRIEGTLREFASFDPVNLWFDYPIHKIDDSMLLKDLEPEGEKTPWQKAIEKRKSPKQKIEDRKLPGAEAGGAGGQGMRLRAFCHG